MQQQSELFKELVPTVNSDGQFLEYRSGKKIIQIPVSVWKDGRTRADLSAYDKGEIVSRNRFNLQERVENVLRSIFPSLIESVREEFARDHSRSVTPRRNNKRPGGAIGSDAHRYINPFVQDWAFARCPDWLFSRRELTYAEKLVYAKLLFPLPRPLCEKFDQEQGVIFGLNQGELAKRIGIRRETANAALSDLRKRGLLEIIGRPGAKQVVRFFWHEWMDTCAENAQVRAGRAVSGNHIGCVKGEQRGVRRNNTSCERNAQVPEGIEKRDGQREERKRFCSFVQEDDADSKRR